MWEQIKSFFCDVWRDIRDVFQLLRKASWDEIVGFDAESYEYRSKRMGKFELFEGKNGDWYWRLKAANGEIIAVSEGYNSKQGAESGIQSVKENAPIAEVEVEQRKKST